MHARATVVLLLVMTAVGSNRVASAHGIKITDLGPVVRIRGGGNATHAARRPKVNDHVPENLEDDDEDAPADDMDGIVADGNDSGHNTGSRKSTAALTSPPALNGKQGGSPALASKRSAVGVPFRGGLSNPNKVEEEEEKLKNATVKLVLWLRNRLKKRLGDVATLEAGMETEKILLHNLNESIVNTTATRKNEIRLKLRNQKKLSDFRRKAEEPESQLRAVQNQDKKLSDQLALLGESYNSLAEQHKKIRAKLRSAGFSHWLDARGKEYMPATAVGVLSKSTDLFEPLAHGVGRAVELDKKLASEMELIVPRLAERSLVGKVFEDLVMLFPIMPMLCLVFKVLQRIHTLSVLHLVMYAAAAFAAESTLLLVSSAVLGREPLRALQEAHEQLLIAGIFINVVMYSAYMFTQILVSILRVSKVELVQTILGMAIGYHYYFSVFRPAMVNENVSTTVINHLMCSVSFCLIVYEKKRVLNLRTPYEEECNALLLSLEQWLWETVDAMSNVFYEHSTDRNMYSEGTASVSLSSIASDDGLEADAVENRAPLGRFEREPVPLQPSRPLTYGRWAGARIINSARRDHARALLAGGEEVPVVVRSGSRRRTPFTQSESDNSSAYVSCRE